MKVENIADHSRKTLNDGMYSELPIGSFVCTWSVISYR